MVQEEGELNNNNIACQSQASWGRLELKPNKKTPKREREGKGRKKSF
jgi:hypothetical protein